MASDGSTQTIQIRLRNRVLKIQRVCSGYYRGADLKLSQEIFMLSDAKFEELKLSIQRVKGILLRIRKEGTNIVISCYRSGQLIIDFQVVELILLEQILQQLSDV